MIHQDSTSTNLSFKGDSSNNPFTKEWIQNEYNLLHHHEETIQKALELKYSLHLLQQHSFPELSNYFPQTMNEIEIQQFNLNVTLPKRLFTSSPAPLTHASTTTGVNNTNVSSGGGAIITSQIAETIAFWILEKRDLINSNSLSLLLQQYQYQNILYSIAMKICSLEIGNHFIDGLKYYLPVCGFWNITFPSHPRYDAEMVNYVLEVYVKAHLTTSAKPLLSNTLDHFTALMEIGIATIELCQALQEQKKPSTMIMSEFYSKVRLALRKTDGMTLSVKSINSLFMTASASLITDIIPPPSTSVAGAQGARLTSYLFTSVKKFGYLSIGMNDQEENLPLYEVYLCSNAMYLFEPTDSYAANADRNTPATNKNKFVVVANKIERKKLFAVIPLKNVHLEKSHTMNDQEEMLHNQLTVELFDKLGEKVNWILYQECDYQSKDGELYTFDAPVSVEYYDQFIVRIQQNPTISSSSSNYSQSIEEWLDALTECSWQS